MSEELAAVWEAVRALEKRQVVAEGEQKKFRDEVRGHLSRISEESREGRGNMMDSNREVVRELRSLRTHVDDIIGRGTHDRDQYNRNAQGTAVRLGTLETTVAKLDASVQELTKELLRRRATDKV